MKRDQIAFSLEPGTKCFTQLLASVFMGHVFAFPDTAEKERAGLGPVHKRRLYFWVHWNDARKFALSLSDLDDRRRRFKINISPPEKRDFASPEPGAGRQNGYQVPFSTTRLKAGVATAAAGDSLQSLREMHHEKKERKHLMLFLTV